MTTLMTTPLDMVRSRSHSPYRRGKTMSLSWPILMVLELVSGLMYDLTSANHGVLLYLPIFIIHSLPPSF